MFGEGATRKRDSMRECMCVNVEKSRGRSGRWVYGSLLGSPAPSQHEPQVPTLSMIQRELFLLPFTMFDDLFIT